MLTQRKQVLLVNFPTPTNVTELESFTSMVNQLGKFVSGIANISEPLWQLCHKDSTWYCDGAQETVVQWVKKKLASPEILAHYNPNCHCRRCATNRAGSSYSSYTR